MNITVELADGGERRVVVGTMVLANGETARRVVAVMNDAGFADGQLIDMARPTLQDWFWSKRMTRA